MLNSQAAEIQKTDTCVQRVKRALEQNFKVLSTANADGLTPDTLGKYAVVFVYDILITECCDASWILTNNVAKLSHWWFERDLTVSLTFGHPGAGLVSDVDSSIGFRFSFNTTGKCSLTLLLELGAMYKEIHCASDAVLQKSVYAHCYGLHKFLNQGVMKEHLNKMLCDYNARSESLKNIIAFASLPACPSIRH